MMQAPFIWGPNGQQLTPGQVKVLREMAAQKVASQGTPKNLGEGLASVGNALLYNANTARADEAESSGQAKVAQALAEAQASGDPDAFYSVLAEPWATEGQRLVAGSLLDRQYALSDRDATWGREDSLRADEWARQDALLADEREYNAPVRDLQIEGLGLENETGQFALEQAKEGFTPLVDPGERAAYGISPEDTSVWYVGPDGKPYNEAPKTSGGITINTGGASDDFYKKLDTDAGEQQAALLDAGRNASSNNMRLGQLAEHLATAPQGAAGAFTQFAGALGIPMEGLDDLQAAQALINQMVPGQRPPGSGTMSDADLALFKQSLPAIINQPGGNKMILETAKAINDYTIAQAKIAEMVANREITPAEGRAMQAAVPNPLAEFSGASAESGWTDLGGGVRIRKKQ